MVRFLVSILVAGLLTSGCSERQSEERFGPPSTEAAAGAAKSEAPAGGPMEDKAQQVKSNAPVGTVARKIIYTAEVELITDHFAQAESEVARLVHQYNGYLAGSEIRGATGQHRYGTWKARVPIDRFEAFLDAVSRLGELQRRQLSSQDVTEEYFDLEARIKNKKVEESRLLKHLEESTGKLEEILKVEKEISRIREEIERQQGRLQLLANLTALTTVSITIHERLNYVPPAAPTFLTRVSRTFLGSVDRLRNFGEAVVLFAVALAPWVPLIALAAVVVWLILRRSRRTERLRDRAVRVEGQT